MKCVDCCYYYADVDYEGNVIDLPHCHYYFNDGYAPCEINDDNDFDD